MSSDKFLTIRGENGLAYIDATFRNVAQSKTMEFILDKKEDSSYINLSMMILKYLLFQMILIHHALNFEPESIEELFQDTVESIKSKKINNHVLYEDTIRSINELANDDDVDDD